MQSSFKVDFLTSELTYWWCQWSHKPFKRYLEANVHVCTSTIWL